MRKEVDPGVVGDRFLQSGGEEGRGEEVGEEGEWGFGWTFARGVERGGEVVVGCGGVGEQAEVGEVSDAGAVDVEADEGEEVVG